MRLIAIASILMMSVITTATAAASECRLRAVDIVGTSPYIVQNMQRVDDGADGSVSLVHRDDPRIAAIVAVKPAQPLGNVSRSEYVRQIEEHALETAVAVRSMGRWAEHSVFPFDPVGWRVSQQQPVPNVGDARVAHLEVRMTPECILTADLVAPDNVNLRSRWIDLQSAVIGLRDTAAQFIVPEAWAPERAVPSGMPALIAGIAAPVAVTLALYFLLQQMTNLDPPGTSTRIVLACAAATAAGTIYLQRELLLEAPHYDLGTVVSGPLMAILAAMALAGAMMKQRAALLGLLSVLVGGISVGASAGLDWAPDRAACAVIGGAMLLFALFGFYGWTEASHSARLKAAQQGKVSGAARPA